LYWFLHQEADEERGSVATEYGLLLALIALAIVAAALVFGLAVAHLFD
jgi:Flp pilus assembly pilin Flp